MLLHVPLRNRFLTLFAPDSVETFVAPGPELRFSEHSRMFAHDMLSDSLWTLSIVIAARTITSIPLSLPLSISCVLVNVADRSIRQVCVDLVRKNWYLFIDKVLCVFVKHSFVYNDSYTERDVYRYYLPALCHLWLLFLIDKLDSTDPLMKLFYAGSRSKPIMIRTDSDQRSLKKVCTLLILINKHTSWNLTLSRVRSLFGLSVYLSGSRTVLVL